MLADFDQSTMANMTAALEYVCKRIPKEKDNHETRKSIAGAVVGRAKSGSRDYVDLQNVGMEVLGEVIRPSGFRQLLSAWFSKLSWRISR